MNKSWVFWVQKCVSCVFLQKRMCVFLLNLCNNILSWWFEFCCKSFCFWFVKLTDVKRAEMSGVTGVVTRTQKRLLSRWRCGDPAICPSSAECTVTNSATRSRRTSRNWGWGNVLKVGTMTNINIIIGHCRSLIVLPNWGISRIISLSVQLILLLTLSFPFPQEVLSRSHQRPVKI